MWRSGWSTHRSLASENRACQMCRVALRRRSVVVPHEQATSLERGPDGITDDLGGSGGIDTMPGVEVERGEPFMDRLERFVLERPATVAAATCPRPARVEVG